MHKAPELRVRFRFCLSNAKYRSGFVAPSVCKRGRSRMQIDAAKQPSRSAGSDHRVAIMRIRRMREPDTCRTRISPRASALDFEINVLVHRASASFGGARASPLPGSQVSFFAEAQPVY